MVLFVCASLAGYRADVLKDGWCYVGVLLFRLMVSCGRVLGES